MLPVRLGLSGVTGTYSGRGLEQELVGPTR